MGNTESKFTEFFVYPRTIDFIGMGIVGIFLLRSIPKEPLDSTAFLPNLLLLSIEIISLILISWFKGERRCFKLPLLFLSFLPPLYFILLAWKWIKEQKEAGNPFELYAGVYLLMMISGFFFILSATIIGISLIFTPMPSEIISRLIFILFLGPLSMMGWWIGSYLPISPPEKPTLAKLIFLIGLIWLLVFIFPVEFAPIYL